MPALASVIGTEKLQELSLFGEDIITSEAAVEVLEKFAEIAEKGYLLEGTVGMDHTQSQTAFMRGEALFIPNGDHIAAEMANVEAYEGFEWAMTASPAMTEDQDRYVQVSQLDMCIIKGAENVDLAKEFIRFMYSDEVVVILARDGAVLGNTKDSLTVAGSYLSEDYVAMHEVDSEFPAISFDWATVPTGSRIALSDEVYAPISDVMNGDMTVAEWVQGIEDALHAINAGE